MRARGAEGRGDQNSGRRIFLEMRGAVDAHRHALAGSYGAGRDLERRAQFVLLEAPADGVGELRGLGRNRLQLQPFLLLHEDQHGGRMQQHAQAVGDALHHGCRVGQAVQRRGRPGKLQQKFLEPFVRLRHAVTTRITRVGCQWTPSALAKRLKTIGLQIKLRCVLKLSQGNTRGQCRDVKRHQNDTGVSFCYRAIE